MVKIVYLTRPMKGGMKKHLYLLLKNIDRSKFSPILIGDEKSCEEFEVEKFLLPLQEKFFTQQDFLIFKKLLELTKKGNVDIVHCHGYKTLFLGVISKIFLKLPVVITIHNYLFYGNKISKKLYEKFLKLFWRYFNIIIVVSEDLKRYLEERGVKSKKIRVVYNGIEIEKLEEINRKKEYKLVGTVSRFVPEKGIIYLVRAIPEVIEEIKNVRFIIIGEGPEYKKIEKEIEKLNLQNFLEILPYQKDISSFLKNLDLLVVPSIFEGAGMIILEAMANRLPVVATKVGGIPEIVRDNQTGILVKPRDIKELSSAITKLLKEDEKSKKMGEFARKIVEEKFDIKIMVRETEKLYEEVLQENI